MPPPAYTFASIPHIDTHGDRQAPGIVAPALARGEGYLGFTRQGIAQARLDIAVGEASIDRCARHGPHLVVGPRELNATQSVLVLQAGAEQGRVVGVHRHDDPRAPQAFGLLPRR